MLLFGSLTFLLVSALLVVRLFISPPASHPSAADAVVALTGGQPEVDAALQLMQRQVAPVLVLGKPGGQMGELAQRLCTERQQFEVVCPSPQGDRLRGDARAVGQLADQRGWRKLAMVAPTAEISRARLLVSRCTQAKVLPVVSAGSDNHRFAQVRDEIGPYVRALVLDRSC